MVSCVRKRAYERHILFKTFAKVRVFFKTSKRFLFFFVLFFNSHTASFGCQQLNSRIFAAEICMEFDALFATEKVSFELL